MDISDPAARGRASARRACVATPDDPSADPGDLTDRCSSPPSPAEEEVCLDGGISLIDAAEAPPLAAACMDDEPPGESKRELVIEAVLDAGVRFWRDARGEAFATVPQAGHLERYALGSRDFRNLVRLLYGERHLVVGRRGGAPRPGAVPEQALRDAFGVFEALALRGELREARPRLCRGPDGAVWLDLGGPEWAAVRVAAEGWRVVEEGADVPLIRPSGLLALPAPRRVESALADLGRLLNLRRGPDGAPGAEFRLVVAWLVAVLHPEGPYPVLALDGEQGSAKTTTARMLRRLVDPNHADARAAPRNERDLLVAARNGRVVALDNLSSLDAATADALCRVATGGGFGERALFTNGDEYIVFACNPVLLNGIPSLLARGDLADRAIAVTLPAIPDEQRRPEAEIWRDFEAARPGILALLLDGLARALRDAPDLRLPRLPRMADFARIACAAAPAFGWTAEAMLAALEENRAGAVAAVIEADPLAVAVQAIAEEEEGRWGSPGWSGTASDLLEEVNDRTPTERQRERDWPKDATRLSGRLRRVAPALRRAGVEVTLPEAGGRAGRVITVRCKAAQRSERSAVVENAAEAGAAAERWNAGDAGAGSDTRAAGPDGAEGQADGGGSEKDSAAGAPGPACPIAGDPEWDDDPAGNDEVVL